MIDEGSAGRKEAAGSRVGRDLRVRIADESRGAFSSAPAPRHTIAAAVPARGIAKGSGLSSVRSRCRRRSVAFWVPDSDPAESDCRGRSSSAIVRPLSESSLSRATYEPLNTLKAVARDLWVVDGPLIRFGPRALSMPFPTRMTVIRLSDDGLFVHSPTPLLPQLAEELEREAERPRWIVGPNRLHYWWIPDWHSAFPQAEVYLAPGIREQSAGRIDFAAQHLERQSG